MANASKLLGWECWIICRFTFAPDASPKQIYSDLTWGGLNKTPVFNAVYPEGNPNRQRILNRYQAEQQGSPAGQGTSQEQTPLGKPCN